MPGRPVSACSAGGDMWPGGGRAGRGPLAPVNAAVFGAPAVQVVGALCTGGLLLALAWAGRAFPRLLLLAGAWMGLGLAPVLSLGVLDPATLANNRLTYLAAAGY